MFSLGRLRSSGLRGFYKFGIYWFRGQGSGFTALGSAVFGGRIVDLTFVSAQQVSRLCRLLGLTA